MFKKIILLSAVVFAIDAMENSYNVFHLLFTFSYIYKRQVEACQPLSFILDRFILDLEEENEAELDFFNVSKQQNSMNKFATCVQIIQLSNGFNKKYNIRVQNLSSGYAAQRILSFTSGLSDCYMFNKLLNKINETKISRNSGIIMWHIIGGYTDQYAMCPLHIAYSQQLYKQIDSIRKKMLVIMVNNQSSITLQDLFDWMHLNREVAEPIKLIGFLNDNNCEMIIQNAEQEDRNVITSYLLSNEECTPLMKDGIEHLSADQPLVFAYQQNVAINM